MTNDGITVSPIITQLKEQCQLLQDELAALIVEHDHLVGTVGPNIMALYATKIGVKEYEALSIDIEVRRLKATIEKIQAIENIGKKPNLEQIEAAVEDELKAWRDKVDQMLSEITAGKERLQNQMSTEDSAALQKLYRLLAKKLHPDLNPNLTDKQKLLWARVQQAYASGDLNQMRALALMVDDIPDGLDLPNQVEQLEKRLADLKQQAEGLIQKLASLKMNPPYSLAAKMADPDWVDAQVGACNARIEALSTQKANLEQWLAIWKGQV